MMMLTRLTFGTIGAGAACAIMVLAGQQPTGPAILCLVLTAVWIGAVLTYALKGR
jgi:hypothetical protein